MQKNSFILVELILSISIIAIFSSLVLYSKRNFNAEFKKLSSLENVFLKNDYTELSTTEQKLTIHINNMLTEEINVKKVEFTNENIKIFKYKL